MADRLRALLDRPLDPSAARAILAFASSILVGFGTLFILAARESDQPTPAEHPSAAAPSPSAAAPTQAVEDSPADGQPGTRRQDPQDVEGSPPPVAPVVPFDRTGGSSMFLIGAKG